MGAPLVRDLVNLLAAFLRPRSRVAQILEHRERRINGPGTRRIHSAEALLDFLDDLVAVARLLIEQAEDHELQVALVEHSPAAERTASRLATTSPERPGIKSEVLRPHTERPSESRPSPAVSSVPRPNPRHN